MLESEGIIEKKPDPTHGKRFIYELTDKGLGLAPAMLEIIRWSNTWDEQTDVPPEFASELKKDRNGLARRIVRQLKEKRV